MTDTATTTTGDTTVVPAVAVPASEAATAADAAVAASAAATAASAATSSEASKAPDAYTLALPEGTTDSTLVERTAATARSLGLSNEAAQALLDARLEERTTRDAAAQAVLDSWVPGGTEWVKRDTTWKAAILADPELGAGDPARVAAAAERVTLVMDKFGSEEVKQFAVASGLLNEPAIFKMFAKLGAAMSESPHLPLGLQTSAKKASLSERMYPNDPK